MGKSLKLTIELVPATSWFTSLYRLLPREEWRSLRRELEAREGGVCWICGSRRGPFEAHEFWEYDEERGVQRLVGIHLLCRLCHMVKHIGFWCYTREGKEKLEQMGLSRRDLVQHFCRVNNCTERDFYEHEREAFKVWKERSNREWKIDFGEYSALLETSRARTGP